MQTANANTPITVTVRHEKVTDSLRDYATKRIQGLHLDYPKIIEAKAILDVQKNRHIVEIILFCANHITIDASTEGKDMYAAIDDTISKIARRMRKHKTRLLRKQRPNRRKDTIKHLDEKVFSSEFLDKLDHEEELEQDPEPMIIHRESYRLKTMLKEDAIMELELSEKPFVVFNNERRDVLQILYRRKDGDYAVIEP
ncbi:ribosome-associated translation inhibitor RaiA [Verrucomicrobiaceae bacterium N1E253]|uniref:Ribosome hibernation promoting factor n=1 Tax=Oceaniferula marina TaxID=2748318 RepID=A0A851GJS1_9BACT|nr:ribosome-associated translation inhibitor RaiA [Oceaniferula marina]NWK55415.1 ribosome-associated translation inhibitor RaiA [Oceaniferula marina]